MPCCDSALFGVHHASDYCARKMRCRGLDTIAQDDDGYTPLHAACDNEHVAVVTTLLEHADVDVQRESVRLVYIAYIICLC